MEETSGGSHWVTAEPDMESGGDGKIVYRLQDQTPQDHKLPIIGYPIWEIQERQQKWLVD